jgi:hypothetical protein
MSFIQQNKYFVFWVYTMGKGSFGYRFNVYFPNSSKNIQI